MGKTGQGKSTAGKQNCWELTVLPKPRIKEWTCEHEKGLLKATGNDETMSFTAACSLESVTKQCQMISNEDTHIRVLDVPGFRDSNTEEKLTTIQVNAKFVNAIVEVSAKDGCHV